MTTTQSETPMPEQTTTPTAKRDPLDEIAPYPKTVEEATAAALIKHYAAFGLMHDRIAFSTSAEQTEAQCRESLGHIASCFRLVFLLRALKQCDPEGADAVAADLWSHQLSGDQSSWLWMWLREDGTDPEGIEDIAAEVEQRRRERAHSRFAPPAADVHPAQVPLPLGEEQP